MHISLPAIGVLLIAISGWTTPAGAATRDDAQRSPAQPVASRSQNDQTAVITSTDGQPINADELGVSIDRIRLRFTRDTGFSNAFDPSKLKMTAYIDVVGQAPTIK